MAAVPPGTSNCPLKTLGNPHSPPWTVGVYPPPRGLSKHVLRELATFKLRNSSLPPCCAPCHLSADKRRGRQRDKHMLGHLRAGLHRALTAFSSATTPEHLAVLVFPESSIFCSRPACPPAPPGVQLAAEFVCSAHGRPAASFNTAPKAQRGMHSHDSTSSNGLKAKVS